MEAKKKLDTLGLSLRLCVSACRAVTVHRTVSELTVSLRKKSVQAECELSARLTVPDGGAMTSVNVVLCSRLDSV